MTNRINKSKGNIFIVEDSPDNLVLITTILRDSGYQVNSSDKGRESISLIISELPGLVILDIKLPDISGYEVCSALKENEKTSAIPVIFISALTQAADKNKAFELGCVDFITKPYNVTEVVNRVQVHLENSMLQLQLKKTSDALHLKNKELQNEVAEHKLAAEKLADSFRKLQENDIVNLKLLEKLTEEVSKHKMTEEQARESEQMFRGLVENASDLVFTITPDGIFTYISPADPSNSGNFVNEAIGKSFQDYIHSEDWHICWKFLREIEHSGNPVTSKDYRVLQKDGTFRWHSARGSALRDKEGNIRGFLGIARDITERKLTDKALEQSEEKFRKAFLTSPDSININRLKDGMFMHINKGFSQIMGYSEEDILGKTSIELNIWKDLNDRKKLVRGIKSKGYVENLEAEFVAKSGEIRYGLMSATLIELDGEPHILSITRDFTERKQAETIIRKIGRHYQALIEKAPDGIVLIDSDGKFIFVSPSAKRIFGYNEEEEIAIGLNELTHPEDMPIVHNEIGKLLADPGYTPTIQYRFAEHSGKYKWIESTFSNMIADPDVGAIVINFRDITDRKLTEGALLESERLLRESQSLAGLGSYIWNISTGLWSSSKILDQIFGIDDKYVRSLEGWGNIVHPDWRDKMTRYVIEEVIGKNQRFDKEYKIIRQDNGQECWVHGLGELEQDSMKQSVILIGTIKDISVQKKAEEEILKLNAELEERVIKRTALLEATNQELEAFSYSVSHDLRAPLRHINGFINLFLESRTIKLSEEELGYLTTVTNSASEMGRLIDALLTFSRLNRAELQKSPINTIQLLQHGLLFFKEEIKKRAIEIEIGPLHDSYGDPQLIRQVWTNLISNAIKYTSRKDIAKIEIASHQKNNELVFSIKDNGAGFDMKYSDKLFGVFQRLHKPREFEGVGIGLANVKRIITRHGGKCWAEGEIDKGAVFYFSLPAVRN